MAKKPECKRCYSESELTALSKLSTTKIKRTYRDKKKDEIAQYNAKYYEANKKHLAPKKQKYNSMYYRANKKDILQNRKKHREINNSEWSVGALQGLLQDKPIYKKCPPRYGRIVKYIDQEQLIDCLNYFKECGEPGYQDMDIDYSYMSTSCEQSHQLTKPTYPEIALNSTIIGPGRKTWLKNSPIITFDGKVVKRDMNIILKLKTMPTQPDVMQDLDVNDITWWIDDQQMLKAVKFWKQKGLSSLRGIRFLDIQDWESESGWTENQRELNKEKVIRSWKYLTTKPRHLLKKYHNFESSDEESDEDEDWFVTAGEGLLQDKPQYKEFCGKDTRREIKWIDPEQLLDCLNYYKKEGLHEYQDFTPEYWLMPTEVFNPEAEPEPESGCTVSLGRFGKQSNPKYCEIGLSNSVILGGYDHTFDGEKVTEDINIFLKLKTMSNQPQVENNAGVYWWIDTDHLIQAVRYWKKRNHPCLEAISFPDISHSSSNFMYNSQQKKKKEENVMKNWKHLTTKPFGLLQKYHQKFLEENDITSQHDLERKFPIQ